MRRALVTGGHRGIGRAIVDQLSAEGVMVVAPMRGELDLASETSVRAWLASVDLTFDVLVNNAGENEPAPFAEVQPERLRRTLEVNLASALFLMQAIAPGMAARGHGRIVNISSVYASRARPGRAAYSASKAALEAITRTAALEFGVSGVLVNAVAPGFVETDLTRKNNAPEVLAALAARTAVGRLAAPAEIAEVVAFLASARNTYLTGQSIVVDGGFSIG
jgi:NAD(P)-dependent dehydrogenase (short-subunit alcohol dehydrogenase family)